MAAAAASTLFSSFLRHRCATSLLLSFLSTSSSSVAKKKKKKSSETRQGGLSTPGGGRGRRGGADSDAAAVASPSSVAGGVGVSLSSPTSARRRGAGGAAEDERGDDLLLAGPPSPEQHLQKRPHRGPPRSWTRGELIGAGAFGRVYLGLDDDTGELFAVKTVSLPSTVSFASDAGASKNGRNDRNDSDEDDLDDDDDDFADLTATTTAAAASRAAARLNDRKLAPHVEALRSEVELLAGLDHPNIVRYLGTEQRAALPEGCSSGGANKNKKRTKKGGGASEEGEESDDGGDENDGEDKDGGGASPHSASGTPKGKKSSSRHLMKKSSSKGKNNSSAQNNLGSELNIFLEYVPGGSIAGLVSRFGPLAERVSASYARQILTGLAYLHAHGIAHRDVKGANCLVGSQGVVKLADFGASKRIEDVATLGENSFFLLQHVFPPSHFLRFFRPLLLLSLSFIQQERQIPNETHQNKKNHQKREASTRSRAPHTGWPPRSSSRRAPEEPPTFGLWAAPSSRW